MSLGETHWSDDLPKSVKIGYRRYAIHVARSRDEMHGNVGLVWHFNPRIDLTPDQSASEAANTLLHEIMHSCCKVFEWQSGDDEERTVTTFANALCSVFADSPDVMAWIARHSCVESG